MNLHTSNREIKKITLNSTPSVFFYFFYLESFCEMKLVKVGRTFGNGGSMYIIDLMCYFLQKGNEKNCMDLLFTKYIQWWFVHIRLFSCLFLKFKFCSIWTLQVINNVQIVVSVSHKLQLSWGEEHLKHINKEYRYKQNVKHHLIKTEKSSDERLQLNPPINWPHNDFYESNHEVNQYFQLSS